MTEQIATLIAEPFLHYSSERIYNTLTDQLLLAGEPGFAEIQQIRGGETSPSALSGNLVRALVEKGWLVETAPDLGSRFRLKYVSFEANTLCNQSCYFCPVSVDPREDHTMSMELYERITAQLAEHRDTIDGISMIHYNEPTADRLFVERVRVLKRYGLPPAVLTNATGLTPERVDAIMEMDGLRYLSINISTLDRERYKQDRGGDHLKLVLRNLDYLKDKPLAPQMDMAVLGKGDEIHRRDYEEIKERFANTRFTVHFYEVMDRAGAVPVGMHPERKHERLAGCEQTGSRVVQWVHITPKADCVLCCQDYYDQHIVGNLEEQTLNEILTGPRMSLMRRWVYGMEQAPDDFICRGCIYALTS
ncbi:MAG TPA: radical SAM protein [Thermoanaerobaculia bacterium]|nr:radical SAM protein [Thermoanaerobaculia bacterium]